MTNYAEVISMALALAAIVAVAWMIIRGERRRHAEALAARDNALTVDEQVEGALQRALQEMKAASAEEQRQMMSATMNQMIEIQREQVGTAASEARQATSAELTAKKDVIDTRLDEVHREMRAELTRLGETVSKLADTSSKRFGEVDASLRAQAEISATLSESAQALRQAMANPSARGQWGERMAEDVLRLAGFVENVNYRKQTQIEGGTGRPDFTFQLPRGHELYMDVKFPMSSYLRFLDASTDTERDAHRVAFLRDVRARVKELSKREYARASSAQSVDYVLMFLPNETLTGFIHENDPSLIDDALEQRVVMASPLTLFAFLGVIRQAHDNFMIEQTSDEILSLIGKFGQEWTRYNAELEKVHNSLDRLTAQFDKVMTTRRRKLDQPLGELEAIRRERGLPIDGQLFAELEGAMPPSADDETPPNLRRLGA